MLVLALHAALLSAPIFVPTAHAQDEDDADFDESEDDGPRKKKSRAAMAAQDDVGKVKEINRGFYAKAAGGVGIFFLDLSGFVDPGTNVTLSFGQDFVDTEKQSMAWEVGFAQGVHNGMSWEEQADLVGCRTVGAGPAPCTEGDLRTYTLQANYEISFYPVRRIGIGVRAGAGIMFSPLLLDSTAYAEDVVGDAFDGVEPGMHNAPKPIVFAGPTFEYYTKLSHLSVGVDVDVLYGIGWDLGLNATGSLKYTF
jgi:hypothetical protein